MAEFSNKYATDFLIEILGDSKKQMKKSFLSQFRLYDSAAAKTIARIKRITFKLASKTLSTKLDLCKLENNVLFWINSYHQTKVNLQEKLLSLDFLHYVLKHHPKIPYSLFDKKDHQKITKFIRNKFLLAFLDIIDKNKLFDHQDYKRQKYYEKFRKNKPTLRHKKYWELIGFKSVVNYFEPAVFIENYGVSLLRKNSFKNATIIDCGAFIGDTAFIFNKYLHPAKILALEPDPFNYQKLKKNIILNELKNIIPLQKAVGVSGGETFINLPGTAGAHLSASAKSEIKVKTDTIDSFVKKLRLTNIKLIKIDIEGLELTAIRGAKETIKKYKPALIVALYHRGQDFFEIPRLLKTIKPTYNMKFINLNVESATREKVLLAQ